MKKLLAIIFLISTAFQVSAQLTAQFKLRESKYLCYTGDASRNTTATFKNNSSVGSYWYVWNYGDGSADSMSVTTNVADYGRHEYKTDGLYTVSLMVIDPINLADSIKIGTIKAVQFISETSTNVTLNISYKNTKNEDRNVTTTVAQNKFAKTRLTNCIEVYSPFVDGSNFTFEIDDPSSDENKAGLESFVYIFSVNQENFKPHNAKLWKYYWSFYDNKNLIENLELDSTEYRFTFPKENFDPGYTVTLKIALDSTKIDAYNIIDGELQSCVASQSVNIKVTDHFFTDSTRTKSDIDDRKTAIPNVFTPGGNDENDVFYFNTNGVDIFTIWIYNNNGALVYKQRAKNISWTGADNSGYDCPSGTYYYVVKSESKDKRHNTAGNIQLFRQN